MKTLDELKAENAATENQATIKTPQVDMVEDNEVEAAKEETQETEQDADSDDDDSEDTEVEDWAKSDEQTSQDHSDTVPVAAHAKVRAKLKAKVEERDSEIDRLKAEIEAIKNGSTAQPKPAGKPSRDSFWEHDDPDEAYLDALADWKIGSKTSQQDEQRKKAESELAQAQRNESINKAVDGHYERAAKLSEQSGITAEAFQSADLAVKQAIESIMPGFGENVVNLLISNLGDGSEKVMYHLGVNKAALSELKDAISADIKDGGMRAAMLLGRKSAQLNQPKKRVSQAPKPASSLNGDGNTGGGQSVMKKKYSDAHSKGNSQLAFDIKRKAKASGINTFEW
jgi:hypothetical protein